MKGGEPPGLSLPQPECEPSQGWGDHDGPGHLEAGGSIATLKTNPQAPAPSLCPETLLLSLLSKDPSPSGTAQRACGLTLHATHSSLSRCSSTQSSRRHRWGRNCSPQPKHPGRGPQPKESFFKLSAKVKPIFKITFSPFMLKKGIHSLSLVLSPRQQAP